MQGLTSEQIEMIQHLNADESMVGENCVVCLSEIEIRTRDGKMLKVTMVIQQ